MKPVISASLASQNGITKLMTVFLSLVQSELMASAVVFGWLGCSNDVLSHRVFNILSLDQIKYSYYQNKTKYPSSLKHHGNVVLQWSVSARNCCL